MNKKRNRRYFLQLKEKAHKLYVAGFTYQEIADNLKLKSHQMAQYHVKSYTQFIHKYPIAKK